MRKLLLGIAAASALGVALPAIAQDYDSRASALQERIDDGVRDGSLTGYEARDLRYRLGNIERMQARYEAYGMRGWQQRDLDRRFTSLSSDIASERHNNQYRYERRNDYGYNGY